MNNNIQEAYCSYEVSKLLKEKGFDCLCHYHYSYGDGDEKRGLNPNHLIYQGSFYDAFGSNRTYRNSELSNWDLPYGEFSMPTHALAIEWIKVNFGIHIKIEYRLAPKDYYINGIWITNPVSVHNPSVRSYNSPQEATEAALLYTLKNLI